MSRVLFNNQPVAPQPNTGRADVACFIGLVRLNPTAVLSTGLSAWLMSLGYPAGMLAALTNVPLPVESYAAFSALFNDATDGTGYGTDYVAATVRSFFAQGGRKCYVVRCGDPVKPEDNLEARATKLAGMLLHVNYSVSDATTWQGIGTLGTLEEVSFVALPDLPALCAPDAVGALGQAPTVAAGPQMFAECSPAQIVPRQYRTFSALAPRLDTASFATWAAAAGAVVDFLSSGTVRNQLNLREMQFVAAMPIPLELDAATAAEVDPESAGFSNAFSADVHAALDLYAPEAAAPGRTGLSSAFLQLTYPWLRTGGSGILLESLEPADGVLVGLLARNALTRGTFTSATKIVPTEVYDVAPALPRQDTLSPDAAIPWGMGFTRPLIERLSLFGQTPVGMRLLSDVTAYNGESYRPGPVNRLVEVVCRAARHAGETAIFQNNGPALWNSTRRTIETLLTRLWELGALDGSSAAQAFAVRCDLSTMTQNDLDNGRLLAQVSFTPAALLETICVALALETAGTSAQEIGANQGVILAQTPVTSSYAEAGR